MSNLTRFAFWVNGVALAFYVFFLLGILYLDFAVFPRWEVLSQPPEVVVDAIRTSTDTSGLKELALLLHEHLSNQTATINQMIDSAIFGIRAHFFAATGVFIFNVVIFLKLRKKTTN